MQGGFVWALPWWLYRAVPQVHQLLLRGVLLTDESSCSCGLPLLWTLCGAGGVRFIIVVALRAVIWQGHILDCCAGAWCRRGSWGWYSSLLEVLPALDDTSRHLLLLLLGG
jgi:hypothetical protein